LFEREAEPAVEEEHSTCNPKEGCRGSRRGAIHRGGQE